MRRHVSLRAGLSSNVMLTNEDMDAIFQCSDDEDGSGSYTGGYWLNIKHGVAAAFLFQMIWRGYGSTCRKFVWRLLFWLTYPSLAKSLKAMLPRCTAWWEVFCG